MVEQNKLYDEKFICLPQKKVSFELLTFGSNLKPSPKQFDLAHYKYNFRIEKTNDRQRKLSVPVYLAYIVDCSDRLLLRLQLQLGRNYLVNTDYWYLGLNWNWRFHLLYLKMTVYVLLDQQVMCLYW